MIRHYSCISNRFGTFAINNFYTITKTCQSRIAITFFVLSENFIVSTVFFGNKYDIFNFVRRFFIGCRNRIFTFSWVSKLEIIFYNYLSFRFKLFIGRNINHRNQTFHQTANITTFSSNFEVFPAIWTTSKAFCIRNYEFFSIITHF